MSLRNVDAVSAWLGDMVGPSGSLARLSSHEPSRVFVCTGDWEILHAFLEAPLPIAPVHRSALFLAYVSAIPFLTVSHPMPTCQRDPFGGIF